MSEFYGIDVAKWQGTINWQSVKAAGKSFAILKATNKNNTVESSFETNYAGATKVGIPVGVYRYVYATNTTQATAEANAVVSVLNGKSIKCGVWLDMEDSSIKKLGTGVLTSIIKTEAAIFQAAGFKVGIYCNLDWYKNVLDSKNLSTLYPFWIARYPSSDNGTMKSSLSPKSYTNVVAWQYSSKGSVSGISGNVDLDVSYRDLSVEMTGSVTKKPNPYTYPTKVVCTKKTATAKKVKSYTCKGSEAKWVQFELKEAGCVGADGKELKIDGDFGANSEYALVTYQNRTAGLTADALAGPATCKSLAAN